MAVRRQGDRWIVEFQQGGRRVYRRLPPGIGHSQAVALETRLRREAFDADALGKRRAIGLADAIGRWLLDTRRKNKDQAASEAKQWEPFVSGNALADAPEVAAEAVRAWRRPRPVDEGKVPAISTVNARLNCLKAVCSHAYDQGWIAVNLSGRIKITNPRNAREVYLTKAEVAKLAGAMETEAARDAVWLLAYCGPRVSELLGHPKATGPRLHFPARTTKNSRARVVPVPVAAQRYLRCLPLDYSYDAFYKEFKAAKKAVGLAHVNIHDLRHTAASWLINAGVDLYVVAAILGDSLQQAQRYSHLADATLRKAMGKLR